MSPSSFSINKAGAVLAICNFFFLDFLNPNFFPPPSFTFSHMSSDLLPFLHKNTTEQISPSCGLITNFFIYLHLFVPCELKESVYIFHSVFLLFPHFFYQLCLFASPFGCRLIIFQFFTKDCSVIHNLHLLSVLINNIGFMTIWQKLCNCFLVISNLISFTITLYTISDTQTISFVYPHELYQ